MSKLFDLKEWLTVADTARHLSIVFGEEVCEADVLRLALDRQLRLSVYFVNHAKARCGKVIGEDEVKWRELSSWVTEVIPNIPDDSKGKPMLCMESLNLDDERFLNLDNDVISIRDVWDLPMIGNERLDIEHEYQNLTGGPAVTLQGLEGAFVEGTDGSMCQLQDSFDQNEFQTGSKAALEEIKDYIANNNLEEKKAQELLDKHKQQRKEYLENRQSRDKARDYYPAGGLPQDSVVVVRTDALREFEHSLSQKESTQKDHKHLSDSTNTDESHLIQSSYWRNLDQLAKQAISDYPAWREKQRIVQKTGNLQEWLIQDIGANNREAEILKKVMADFFQDLR